MINPYDLTDSRQLALIQGYVVDVKDKGDVNMLLFRKDTTKGDGGLVSVAAWAVGEGQDTPDMKKMTDDLKGTFVACIVIVRKKEKDGKLYTKGCLNVKRLKMRLGNCRKKQTKQRKCASGLKVIKSHIWNKSKNTMPQ